MSSTPGPWMAQERISAEEVAEAIFDGAEAEAGWWITGPDFIDCEDSGLFFREDDARLVAAAPELLAALRDIVRWGVKFDHRGSHSERVVARAREAVDLATRKRGSAT